MKNLHNLLDKSYQKIKFKVSKTQHLLIKAKVNGVTGTFILDTGASNSCIGFDKAPSFKLKTSKSETKVAGAGAMGMETLISKENKIKIGTWKTKKSKIIIFDLYHVNQSLEAQKAKPIDGIIGADILLRGQGIIDYFNHYLYLKS
jgi:predicted aspartyl protease